MFEFKYRDDDDRALLEVSENIVQEALKAQGVEVWVDSSEKKLVFACPQCNPKQKREGGRAEYFLPTQHRIFGSYVCKRCGELTPEQVAQLARVPVQALAGKSLLVLNRSEVAIQDAVEEALARSDLVFIKGRQVVIVIIEAGVARLERATVSELKAILATIARSVRFDYKKKCLVESTVPDKVIKDLTSRLSHPHLRPILRIIAHPLLDDAGEVIVDGIGYDKKTLLYQFFDPQKFQSVRQPVSDAEAKVAYERLVGLLTEFEFVEDFDRAAGVLLLVTAVMSPALQTTPMFLIASHDYGVGKTTLSLIASTLATLNPPAVVSLKKDADETSRELMSMLAVRAAEVLVLDNLSNNLPANPTLCSVITGTPITGRIVGSSEVTTTVARTLIVATGTDVVPTKDMIRRTVPIWLRKPETAFKHSDIVECVRARRTEYVCDVLKVVKWGRQKKLLPKITLSSFADWSRYCLAPVEALSDNEPLHRVLKELSTTIPKKTANQIFLEILLEKFDRGVFTTEKIRCDLTPTEQFRQVLIELSLLSENGELNARKVGRWLCRHVGERVCANTHELTRQERISNAPANFQFREI
ncbi:MAG: hypothetical protein EGQ34_03165 [Sutterella sp.]|nr:hypothetical protein [Sutterella sp.]